jgi:hypothetical protein
MIDMFVEKMCYSCLNNKCNRNIEILKIKSCTTYRCNEYVKDKTKIIPYEEPLIVTAERSYVTKKEI